MESTERPVPVGNRRKYPVRVGLPLLDLSAIQLEVSCLSPLGTEVQLPHPALDFLLIDLIRAQLQHHTDVPQMTV